MKNRYLFLSCLLFVIILSMFPIIGKQIQAANPPDCNITGDSTICTGSSTEFCAPNGMDSYFWTGPNGFTRTSKCTGAISDTGLYKVVITKNSESAECGRTLVEYALPVLSYSGDELTCDSLLASATVTSSPSVGVTYLWTPTPVSGQGTTHVRYNTPGTKKVVVTITATGCKDSCNAVITQNVTKPILSCSGDELTCDSLLASATVTSSPSVGVTYLWTPVPVSGQGTAHARYDALGTKKVVVTITATGCKDSCNAVITQNTIKPALSCTGDELTCDSLLASAKVTSNPSTGVTYLWTPVPVSGQGTAHARYDAQGTKKVVVTITATGCKDSCNAVITQNATKPVLSCSGDELTCDSLLASATVTSSPSLGVIYLWTPTPVSGQGTAHARYDIPGTKKVVVTITATGCKDSCDAIITQNITKPALSCSGDELTCDSLGASAKVTSNPSTGVTYLWTPAPISGQGTAHARYDIPGTKKVVVTITATGCKDSCYAVITQNITKPALSCSGDELTCDSLGASAKVTSNPSTGVTYLWTPAPISGQGTAHARYDIPGTKKVVVTITATGCKDSCYAVITQNITKPILTCQGDTLTCDSTLASAKVASNPSIGVSYLWTPIPVNGQGTAHARYDTPGTKKVVVTITATGCKDSCEVVITEDIRPPFITCPDSMTVHSGHYSSGNFTVIHSQGDSISQVLAWVSTSGSGITNIAAHGGTGRAPTTGHVEFDANCTYPGVYSIFIEATEKCGLKDTCSYQVRLINRPPQLTCPNAGEVHAKLNFISTNYSVTDSDGDTAPVTFFGITPSVTHNPTIVGNNVEWQTTREDTGLFTIKLLATDPCGRKDTCEFLIRSYNNPPTANCSVEDDYPDGRVDFNAAGSFDPDANDSILDYRWKWVSELTCTLTTESSDSVYVSFYPTDTGTYKIELWVYDGKLLSEPSFCTYKHHQDNQPPWWDRPFSDANVNAGGDTLRLWGHAKDPDGDHINLSTSSFPQHATFFDSGNGGCLFKFKPASDQEGKTYNVVFIASDGIDNTPDTARIVVNKHVNQPPQINDIPDLAIWRGGHFKDITLDSFVQDDAPKNLIQWTHSGQNHIDVGISNGVAKLTPKDTIWIGAENITFTATDTGNLSDSYTIIASVCEYRPRSIDFGKVRVGNSSPDSIVNIYNNKDTLLEVKNVKYDNVNFKVVYPTSISANNSGQVKVSFKPSHSGQINDLIKISTKDLDTAMIFCKGVGLQESLVVSPKDVIDFGKVNVTDSSVCSTFTVKNQGNASTAIMSVNTNNTVFQIRNNTCIVPLDTGKTCSFCTIFKPNARKAEEGVLIIKHTYDSLMVNLKGKGVEPKLFVYPDSIPFKDSVYLGNSSDPEKIWVENIDSGFLNVTAFEGLDASDFRIDSTKKFDDISLAQNEKEYFFVTFAPYSGGWEGYKFDTLIVHSNGGTDSVYFSGYALSPEWRTVIIDNNSFGEVLVNTKATKTNCYVENISLVPPFILDSIKLVRNEFFGLELGPLPDTLYRDAHLQNEFYFDCYFEPDWSLRKDSTVYDTLVVWCHSLEAPYGALVDTEIIDGTGIAPLIEISPDSISFPDSTLIDTKKGKIPVTIKSTGSYPLDIDTITVSNATVFTLADLPSTFPRSLTPKDGLDNRVTISIDFHPVEVKSYNETLYIISNAYNHKPCGINSACDTFRVPLSGRSYYKDNLSPKIDTITPSSPMTNTSVMIKANVTDSLYKIFSGIKRVYLHYRVGNSDDIAGFDSVEMEPNDSNPEIYEDTIPKTSVTLAGLEYKISAIDNDSNYATTSIFPLRVKFSSGKVSKPSSFWYGSNKIKDQWILLSIPGELDDKSLGSLLTNAMNVQPGDGTWKLVGVSDKGGWEYFEESSTTPFNRPGVGFWFKRVDKDEGFEVKLGSGLTVPTDKPFPVVLNTSSNGWNLIGNPFLLDSLFFQNLPLIDGPYSYGTNWIKPNTDSGEYLLRWKGYAVKNNHDYPCTLYLDLHSKTVYTSGSKGTAPPLPVEYLWKIQFFARAGDMLDKAYLGCSNSCSVNKDRVDLAKPPSIEPTVSIYFPKREWGNLSDDYATDYRGIISDGASWEFSVDNYTDLKEMDLSWEGISSLPTEFEAILYDRLKNVTVNLREKESYHFTHYQNHDTGRFKVFVGRSGYVENEISSTQAAIPKEFQLGQNYPNPFNPWTSINFDIPQGGQVKVRIYNVLGQSVVTLYDKLTYPGKYTVTWNGKDKEGREVSSGIYFYQLSTPGFSKSLKMILLK